MRNARYIFGWVSVVLWVTGCAQQAVEHDPRDRLAGTWVVDISESKEGLDDFLASAVGDLPADREEDIRRRSVELLESAQFKFSADGKIVSTTEGPVAHGEYEILWVEDNELLIREYYPDWAEYDESSPQEIVDALGVTANDTVPLHMGISFLDADRFRIFKLLVVDGEVTHRRRYGYEIFRRD